MEVLKDPKITKNLAVEQLPALLERSIADPRLAMSHTSLLMAILKLNGNMASKGTIAVSRRELMRFTKFRSIRTYHKCMRGLVECGYIKYCPSYHPINGSLIIINYSEILA